MKASILHYLKLVKVLLLALLCFVTPGVIAQTATVTQPFAVGRTSCGSGTHQIHYYNYNGTSNSISLASTPVACVPQLRYGATNFTFTSGLSSISYNPKDQNIYYLYTRLSNLRTFVWRWPIGSCPTSTSPRLDTLRSFAYDILGVTFDKNGNGYMLEFSLTGPPYTALLRSIDFTTGTYGQADTLDLTGGAKIYSTGTGDVAMSPSGQMYFVVDNKLFTPDYSAYGGPNKKITCTYIDTVRSPGGNLVGLTFAEGELIAAYQGGGCRFREIAPMTGDTTIISSSTTRSTSDFASVISGVGVSKSIFSVTPTGVPNQYDVDYDVRVQNYGNYPISAVQVNDTLSNINGASNVTLQSVSFISNPAGLVLNASYNGKTNTQLFNGSGSLPNYPTSNNFAIIRIRVRLSGILQGVVYNNSATARATGFSSASLIDRSTNGSVPDLNSNDKPDDAGEDQPTPLLIAVSSFTPPCSTLGQVLYNETFGTGAVTTSLNAGGNSPTGGYTGSLSNPLPINTFKIGNNATLGHNTNWSGITDHTSGSGRMLMVNADANNLVVFSDDLPVLCANQQYSLSFYAAFPGNSNYQTICNAFGGFRYPKLKIRIRDAISGLVITENSTPDITSNSWNQYGLKFVMPSGFSAIIFELINDAQGGCGNDILIDDIQFGLCDAAPTVTVNTASAGCIGGSTSMDAVLSDASVIPGAKDYQWQISSDGVSWNNIPLATSSSYMISSVSATDVGKYYRVIVASQGNMATPSCQYQSASYQLNAKSSSIAPTSAAANRTNICPSDAVTLQVNGGTLGTNASWRWYSSSCGGTLVGTGTSINVNPSVTTTYYVRAEGDCNITGCASVTVTVNCDIDDDNDGITDLAESGGVDPSEDHDFDGIENYRDSHYPGFTDSNGDGIHDPFDNDLDGIINSLDLDSDNDGIPDVVESGGVDANGDGVIDNYSDTDNDGLSQNADANNSGHLSSGSGLGLVDTDGDGVPNLFDLDSDNDGLPDVYEVGGNDANNNGMIDGYSDADADGFADTVDGDADNNGIAENSANSLLRTGADLNNDGRADSYPYKNFDSDQRANAYDLDSDNDGITDVREAGFGDANSNGFSDGVKGSDGWDDAVASMATLVISNNDGDILPDYTDIDSDNDGVPDNVEGISTASYRLPAGLDDDADGIDNSYDNTVGFGGNGITPNDQDNDSIPDYLDQDTDGDSASDAIEANDINNNCDDDDPITLTGLDTDNDGLDDRFDADNSSIKGTSMFMGNFGTTLGDASPGSFTRVNMCNASGYERDWRFLPYVLEVTYHDISASRKSGGAMIHWTVSCDKRISHFIVEKSVDGKNFKQLGRVNAKGTSLTTSSFELFDPEAVNVKVYYRVITFDNQHHQQQSRSVMVREKPADQVTVYPNPTHEMIYLSISSSKDQNVRIRLSNSEGRLFVQQRQDIMAGDTVIRLKNNSVLPAGLYLIDVFLGNERKQYKLIVW